MKAEPLLPRLPQLLCQRCTQRACPQHWPCTPKGKGDRTRLFFQAPWLPLPQTISQVRPHFQHSFNELGNKCSSCPLPPLSQDWRAWAATPGAAALCWPCNCPTARTPSAKAVPAHQGQCLTSPNVPNFSQDTGWPSSYSHITGTCLFFQQKMGS